MPIVVTFDLSRPSPRELNRIRGVFERLGWERLGNTVYRYPRLEDQPESEDWFNRVIPALMMLRALARHAATNRQGLVRFTLDAQSSTGYDSETNAGTPPLPASEIEFSRPSHAGGDFSQRRLEDWLDGIEWPYAQDAGP